MNDDTLMFLLLSCGLVFVLAATSAAFTAVAWIYDCVTEYRRTRRLPWN